MTSWVGLVGSADAYELSRPDDLLQEASKLLSNSSPEHLQLFLRFFFSRIRSHVLQPVAQEFLLQISRLLASTASEASNSVSRASGSEDQFLKVQLLDHREFGAVFTALRDSVLQLESSVLNALQNSMFRSCLDQCQMKLWLYSAVFAKQAQVSQIKSAVAHFLFANLGDDSSVVLVHLLMELGWEDITEFALPAALKLYLRDMVKNLCDDSLNENFSNESSVLESTFANCQVLANRFGRYLNFEDPLRRFILQTFIDNRSKQMFELVREFPESLSSLIELRNAASELGLLDMIAKELQNALQTRLLHCAATTDDILTQMMLLIRVVKILDPGSETHMAQDVCRPVESYLRSRKDVVRCIVDRFCQDDPEILMKIPYDLDEHFPNLPSNLRDDYLQYLIRQVVGKEAFAEEYKVLLGERLLGPAGYDLENEIARVESLKSRIGERSGGLSSCEVMLADVSESKRLWNRYVLSRDNYLLNCKILSKEFWPQHTMDFLDFKLPSGVQAEMDSFAELFQSMKEVRELKWLPNCGHVTLSLRRLGSSEEFRDLSCSPLQASVFLRLSELPNQKASLPTLLTDLKVEEEEELLNALNFWERQGFLVQEHLEGIQVFQCVTSGMETDNFVEQDTSSLENRRIEQSHKLMEVISERIASLVPQTKFVGVNEVQSLLQMLELGTGKATSLSKTDIEKILFSLSEKKVLEEKDGRFKRF